MKKVKLMLIGMGILAVVGGSLAFKAQKEAGIYYCAPGRNQAFVTTSTYTTSTEGQTCYYILKADWQPGDVGTVTTHVELDN